ncbi:hypothetical protein PV797_09885 [Clostridiaceae bacterium M8S5]|nr:hypothetical protein PV797_09885 [Clostridiaceae bacterium M8S5]
MKKWLSCRIWLILMLITNTVGVFYNLNEDITVCLVIALGCLSIISYIYKKKYIKTMIVLICIVLLCGYIIIDRIYPRNFTSSVLEKYYSEHLGNIRNIGIIKIDDDTGKNVHIEIEDSQVINDIMKCLSNLTVINYEPRKFYDKERKFSLIIKTSRKYIRIDVHEDKYIRIRDPKYNVYKIVNSSSILETIQDIFTKNIIQTKPRG